MSSDEANDFLFGSGVPGVKWDEVGTEHKGRIVAMRKTQQKDYTTRKPKFWDDGSPMWQAVITIQTEERDPEIEDDDGRRKIYIANPRMRDAVRDAVLGAGARKLKLGGMFKMKFTGTDPESKNPANPAKLYVARYKPPEPGQELSEEPPPPEPANDYDDYGDFDDAPF